MIHVIYVCTGAHEGQKLESQKERQAQLSFLLLLTIIIHILTGIIIIKYNSADFQACYLAKNDNIYNPAGLIVKHIMK